MAPTMQPVRPLILVTFFATASLHLPRCAQGVTAAGTYSQRGSTLWCDAKDHSCELAGPGGAAPPDAPYCDKGAACRRAAQHEEERFPIQDRMLNPHPEPTWNYIERAKWYGDDHQPKRAREWYWGRVLHFPDDGEAWSGIGEAYFADCDDAKLAKPAWRARCLGKFQEGLACLEVANMLRWHEAFHQLTKAKDRFAEHFPQECTAADCDGTVEVAMQMVKERKMTEAAHNLCDRPEKACNQPRLFPYAVP